MQLFRLVHSSLKMKLRRNCMSFFVNRNVNYSANASKTNTLRMNKMPITPYIKNWADTSKNKYCGSHPTLFGFDSDMLRNAQLFIYRKSYQTINKSYILCCFKRQTNGSPQKVILFKESSEIKPFPQPS